MCLTPGRVLAVAVHGHDFGVGVQQRRQQRLLCVGHASPRLPAAHKRHDLGLAVVGTPPVAQYLQAAAFPCAANDIHRTRKGEEQAHTSSCDVIRIVYESTAVRLACKEHDVGSLASTMQTYTNACGSSGGEQGSDA